jgi:hypothetical protein
MASTPADFRELLEAELQSCVMPEVDPDSAEPEAILRDMHRVLAGNGGVTRGLLYKVAAANAHVKCLDTKLADTRASVKAQQEHCQLVTARYDGVLGNAEILATRRVWGFIWKHRTTLLILTAIILSQLLTHFKLTLNREQDIQQQDSIQSMAIVLRQLADTTNYPSIP